MWLTYAQQPLQYSKADFSEPSNQIVKEHHMGHTTAQVGRYSNRIRYEVNAVSAKISDAAGNTLGWSICVENLAGFWQTSATVSQSTSFMMGASNLCL